MADALRAPRIFAAALIERWVNPCVEAVSRLIVATVLQ